MRAFYVYAPLCGLFILMPHYAGFLCLCPTMRAFYIYAPLCGLFMFTPHYAGFLYLCPTMRAFYIYAPLCGLFMFMPHYAGFLYLCPTMRAFVWPLRGRTLGDNKMSALACPCENQFWFSYFLNK